VRAECSEKELFQYPLSSTDPTVTVTVMWLVNNELERLLNEFIGLI
jgi:hypothetical protein